MRALSCASCAKPSPRWRPNMGLPSSPPVLIRPPSARVIQDSSYIWWAMRPSLLNPTLELRAPDSCTLVEDGVAIAALYRTLARHLYVNRWRNADLGAVARAIIVENKWQAPCYGVSARVGARVR